MTNLKKTLAVVLAFAMILSMGAISTFAYSDVTAGTVVSEAVGILSNLNILTGFEDGTFKPDETVTRAQMAAIICRTLGYEDQAKSSMGSTVFNDVAADHWAAGYINVAQAQQIINGYGDGNYGPEDKVTYEQAVKMIVSALGYDLAAQRKGGYPTGYLAIASAEGITKNANGRVGDAAARGTIAVLVYNSLEVQLMDQNAWTTDGTDTYAKTGKTILSQYLDINKWEGVVSATPLVGVAGSGYNADDTPEIQLTGEKLYSYKSAGVNSYNYVLETATAPSTIESSYIADVDKFIGKKVVAYIGDKADDVTGNNMLYAIAEKQGANDSIVINATQLVEDDTTANELSYRKEGSSKVYDLALNPAATGYINYAVTSNSTLKAADLINTTVLATEDIATILTNGGTVELIDNDTTVLGYDTLIITQYDAEGVVKTVETDEEDIIFETYTGTVEAVDTAADDELVIVYKDGVLATVEDIVANDTVSTAQIYGDDVRVLYVSSASVTGTVEGYSLDDETVTIGGTDYEVSPNGPSIISLKDKEGIFFLNVDGQIAYADASAAKGNYALVLATGKDGSMGDYIVTLALADGTVATYDLAANVNYNGTSTKAEDTANALAGLMNTDTDGAGPIVAQTYTKNEAYTHTNTASLLLFEVKLVDGEVKKLTSVTVPSATTSKYNEERNAAGSMSFDENTVIFALKEAATGVAKVEEADVQVGKVADFLVDDESFALAAFDYENKVYSGALGYNLVTSIAADSAAIIVSSTKTISYNDDAAYLVSGLQAGKEVSYIIYNEDGTYRSASANYPGEIGKGDVIRVSAADAENVVDDFEILFKRNATAHFSAGVDASDVPGKKMYYHASDLDYTKEVSDDFIWLATGKANVTAGTTSGVDTYVLMQNAANYTLVDYTEDAKNPEISKKSANKSIIGRTDKYDSYVFVRINDEELAEVVVYRTLKAISLTLVDNGDGTLTVNNPEGASLTYYKNDVKVSAAEATTGLVSTDEIKVVAVKEGKATTTKSIVIA